MQKHRTNKRESKWRWLASFLGVKEGKEGKERKRKKRSNKRRRKKIAFFLVGFPMLKKKWRKWGENGGNGEKWSK